MVTGQGGLEQWVGILKGEGTERDGTQRRSSQADLPHALGRIAPSQLLRQGTHGHVSEWSGQRTVYTRN